jgi:hypothetical protein
MADRFEILEETSHEPARKEMPSSSNDIEDNKAINVLEKAVEELAIDAKDVKRASQAKEEGNEYVLHDRLRCSWFPT